MLTKSKHRCQPHPSASNVARMTKLFALLCGMACLVACGPSTPAADTPDDAISGDALPEGGDPADAPAPPSDGIVRDADGDGVPDDASDKTCEGKNETQCKINAACAWSDQGTCVEAKDAPM